MAAEPHNAGPKTERPKTRVISGADSEPELTTTQRRTLDLVKNRCSVFVDLVLADVTSGPLPMLLKDLPFFAPLRASLRWQHYCQAEGFTGTGAGVCSGFPISQVDDETPTYSWLSRPQTRWDLGLTVVVGVASTHTAAPVAGDAFTVRVPIQRDELSSPGDHLKHQHTVVPIAQPATCPPHSPRANPGILCGEG
ncbi:hypothetical protein EDB89DRAFT_1906215 [Lactarius sanguifluus]|nr:hypothetical protein EDB89DRAFT_1906215 [Lactarius sanguifluus]